ncbi:hypothetical protein GGX14DRAFT_660804 [Mycena pura]|uniref:Uncharacterized protein n=1 Tax=Mycena pura TaxID=153505 RepID=A0AAD6V274_9AGAR|nr:hypothetical protein GGX14DRAFT_660804 [Mycena pura]
MPEMVLATKVRWMAPAQARPNSGASMSQNGSSTKSYYVAAALVLTIPRIRCCVQARTAGGGHSKVAWRNTILLRDGVCVSVEQIMEEGACYYKLFCDYALPGEGDRRSEKEGERHTLVCTRPGMRAAHTRVPECAPHVETAARQRPPHTAPTPMDTEVRLKNWRSRTKSAARRATGLTGGRVGASTWQGDEGRKQGTVPSKVSRYGLMVSQDAVAVTLGRLGPGR